MRKILATLLITIITLITLNITSNAASNGNVTATISKNNVKEGETFTLTISASSDSGIIGLVTGVEYNSDILEIESSSILNENYINNGSGANVALSWKETSREYPKEANLYSITFKVKENVTEDSTNITLKGYDAFEKITLNPLADDEVEINNIDKTINIISEPVQGDNNSGSTGSLAVTPSNSNNGNSSNSANSANSANSSNSEQSSQKSTPTTSTSKSQVIGQSNSDKSIPKTGDVTNAIILISIFAISIFGVISYKLHEKYKKI